MGWKGVTIMDQKIRFIIEYREDIVSFSELCHQFDISRKTGYKWVDRYLQKVLKGLWTGQEVPIPGRTGPEEIVDAIVKEKA